MTEPRYPFPRPQHPSEIVLSSPGALAAADIYRLLTHAEAREAWTELTQHSHSIRLMVSDGWVFKTRPNDLFELDQVLERLRRIGEHTARVGIWHPAKTWFALRRSDGYLPCSACPRLVEIEHETGFLLRLRRDVQRAWLGWRALRHRYLLDPKRANFGYDPRRRRLYYIDDDIYSLDGHSLSFS